jgi:intein-encoded DNA endonuclease-like protein
VKDDGDKVILSNATVMHFWQDKNGYIDTEKKERQRMVLKTTSKEQAESWKLSLMESGVEEGDAGGCCTVA